MTIFLALLLKIIPLYILILLGFIGGKYLQVKKESIANLVIYLIAPVIFFNGVFTTKISLSSLSLPFLIFAICCLICLFFYFLSSFFWKDNTKNMLAFISPDGNNGYFGLPIALVLFPSSIIGLYIFAGLGILLYENTLGFFIAAKGKHTVKESLIKLLRLPLIYAVAFGLLANLSGVHFGSIYTDVITNFKGAFTILGMMIIGLGLAGITEYKFDFLFIGLSFLGKFLFWPILVLLIIFLDSNYFKFYNPDAYKILILLSVVPIAANTVSFATLLKSHPEKVAIAVLLSTLFALFYVPLAVTLFIK
jgi:predicted permease